MGREKVFSSMTIGEFTDLIYEVIIMWQLTSNRFWPFPALQEEEI